MQSQYLDPTGTDDNEELASNRKNNFIRMTKGNLMMTSPLKSDGGDPFREVIVRSGHAKYFFKSKLFLCFNYYKDDEEKNYEQPPEER